MGRRPRCRTLLQRFERRDHVLQPFRLGIEVLQYIPQVNWHGLFSLRSDGSLQNLHFGLPAPVQDKPSSSVSEWAMIQRNRADQDVRAGGCSWKALKR